MKVFVGKIHPTRNPNYCVLSGERDGGDLGFWAGPDIDVTGSQIITPHVSRRMAKQWLEADGLVVDANEHEALLVELEKAREERDEAQAAVKQLQKRLGRVFPGRKRTAKAVTA